LSGRFSRSLLLLWLSLGGGVFAGAEPVVQLDWGPFFARWQDVRGAERTRFLGPIGQTVSAPDGNAMQAVHPFYFSLQDAEHDLTRTDVLWPLFVRRTREDAVYWRFLLSYYWNWDMNDSDSPWRFWSLPFYFQGRDHRGEPYLALFPLAGSIHDFFFWDRINFVLFPLFVQSQMNEIQANSFLWPFISRTEGPGIERFRIFPFYGYNTRENEGRRTFVLWPFWNQVHYTLPRNPGRGWILFPLAGHLQRANEETWWVIPPFFRYTRSDKQNQFFGPWPLLQTAEGEVDKFYLFPFYGRKSHAGKEQRFFLWPLGHHETAERRTGHKTKTRFIPFYQRYVEDVVEDGLLEGRRHYTKIWPLGSHLSEEDGQVQRTAVLDLNPFRGGAIERNYATFWQIFLRTRVEDAVDTEVLWGLYRSARRGEDYQYRSLFPLINYSREPDGGHFQLLKGLLGRRRQGDKTRWRVLYLFRFGDTGEF